MVDDHPPNLVALEAALSPLGQPFRQATSGAEALRLLEQEDFAVALLDVRMPGLSGLDVATRLRERRIHTPIIFISAAQEDSTAKADGYDRGAVDFIFKPFDPGVLRAKVRTFVQLHAQRRELERLSASNDAERRIARQRVQTLANVSSGLSRWPGKDEAAELVVGEAHAALQAAASAAYLLSDDARELVLIARRGAPPDWLPPFERFALELPLPLTAAVQQGAPLWLENREALLRAFPGLAAAPHTRAVAVLPVRTLERTIGALALSFEQPKSWDAAEREFALTLVGQLTAALERERLLGIERRALRELEQRSEAMRFMADLSTLLSSSLEYPAVLRRLTERMVPFIADWCAVDVLDASGRVQRLTAFHSDPEKVALALELERRYPVNPDAPHGVPRVLRTGETEWQEQIPPELLVAAARDAEHLSIIHRLGLESYVTVPIQARGRMLGALSLVYAESRRRYSAEDVRFVEEVARRAALAVDNALLFREAQRLIAQLDRSNKELDQFAYVASHDLKAPLRGIANLSEWLEEDLGDAITPDGKQQLALLRNRVQRMEGLINGILDFSRAGRVRSKAEPVPVQKLLSDVIELCAVPPHATIEVEDGMPELHTERVPLQQVFMNLIGNALKHAKREDPRVVVGVKDLGHSYQFTVTDNGPGIAPEYHERIWGIFQTLEPRDTVEGTGIGLSIVKKIVEGKGGEAWVRSREGEGATFGFTWPKAEAEAVTSV
jgi:signal transduction histidine kinase/CheY-like chemotaxis protein